MLWIFISCPKLKRTWAIVLAGAQFCDLRFNAQYLFILHISGLAGIQKEFLR